MATVQIRSARQAFGCTDVSKVAVAIGGRPNIVQGGLGPLISTVSTWRILRTRQKAQFSGLFFLNPQQAAQMAGLHNWFSLVQGNRATVLAKNSFV